MTRFFAADLSQLAPAALIETLDYEAILSELKSYVRSNLPTIDTLDLESEPITVVLQVIAYREVLLRALVNDKARAVLLAESWGNNLDHLGALMSTARRQIGLSAQNEPVYQDDAEYREEIQLAPEAFSVAGPEGAYVYFARRAHASIVDVAVLNPRDNRIDIVLLARDGDGEPTSEAVSAVVTALSPKTVRPLDDDVHVLSRTKVEAVINVRLQHHDGPDPIALKSAAEASLVAYKAARRKIGLALRVDGIIGAARMAGDIEKVIVDGPTEDVDPGAYGFVHVSAINVSTELVE